MNQEEKIKAAAREIVLLTDKTLSAWLRDIGKPSAPTEPELLDDATQINAQIIMRHLNAD